MFTTTCFFIILAQMNDSHPKLAISHTVHKEIGIFEMMMSLFYHPRNSHCFFIDQKADPKVFKAVNGIVKCYREIFHQVTWDDLFIRQITLIMPATYVAWCSY